MSYPNLWRLTDKLNALRYVAAPGSLRGGGGGGGKEG